MKPLTLLFIFIFISLLLVFSEVSSSSTIVDEEGTSTNTVALSAKHHYLPKINCKYECSRRCSKVRRKKICMRACGTCCSRCHCVPPGTYGNHQVCPCYARLKTHANKPKCP